MLTYEPRLPIKERHLLYGSGGSGKSNAAISLMRRIPDRHFYIVDNDDAYERLIYGADLDSMDEATAKLHSQMIDRGNFTLFSVDYTDWKEQLEAAREASAKAEAGDWYFFDMVTETWDAVQGWFVQSIYNVGRAEHAMTVRQEQEDTRRANIGKAKKEQEKIVPVSWASGDDDRWSVINPEYKELYRTFTQCRGHVLFTAEAESIGERDNQAIRAMFNPLGAKPKGQKRMAHIPHTVVFMQRSTGGKWQYSNTAKDRGRALVDKREWSDWVKDYLMPVAKWKPVRVEA